MVENIRENRPNMNNIATRSSWEITPMPSKYRTLSFSKKLTEEQMNILRRGYIPQSMEEKWFYYMEGNILYAHRGWTGICLFTVTFNGENSILTLNEEELDTLKSVIGLPYSCKKAISMLIDGWAGKRME